jgi:hypothetical protein
MNTPFTINPDAASVKRQKRFSVYFQQAAELGLQSFDLGGSLLYPSRQPRAVTLKVRAFSRAFEPLGARIGNEQAHLR